jgi:hypothetical protein
MSEQDGRASVQWSGVLLVGVWAVVLIAEGVANAAEDAGAVGWGLWVVYLACALAAIPSTVRPSVTTAVVGAGGTIAGGYAVYPLVPGGLLALAALALGVKSWLARRDESGEQRRRAE